MLRINMSTHNYFFYFRKEMPWKMPYKIKGRTVLVKKGKKWRVLKKHPTKAKAIAHLRALEINVEHRK